MVASCRFRRLNSLRRFPAQCIAASLFSLQVHYYIRLLFALTDLLFEVFAIGKLESLWRGPEGAGFLPAIGMTVAQLLVWLLQMREGDSDSGDGGGFCAEDGWA